MHAYHLEQLLSAHRTDGKLYLEFLRVPDLSVGLYILPAGGKDPQLPHSEDEVYYIISGSGYIRVDKEDLPVKAGSIIYVPKMVEHRFHSISEELRIIVFFAPAEYANRHPQKRSDS